MYWYQLTLVYLCASISPIITQYYPFSGGNFVSPLSQTNGYSVLGSGFSTPSRLFSTGFQIGAPTQYDPASFYQSNGFFQDRTGLIDHRNFDLTRHYSGPSLFRPAQSARSDRLYFGTDLFRSLEFNHPQTPAVPSLPFGYQLNGHDFLSNQFYQLIPNYQPLSLAHQPAESKAHRAPLATNDLPIVKTDKGMVRARKMTSRSGNQYYAFTSIPYAKPPIGKLRFEKPEPADAWSNVRDGLEDLPECWQTHVFSPASANQTSGTEDCLYLSVFTPQVGKDQRLPVMVYIPGGAFRAEFPSVSRVNVSRYFLDEDVVLVTFKYRTGAFGFLSLEDKLLPGNMGLKDSALALDWVKRNIEEFGGDPNRITLFGNDAGGAIVHYFLTSPTTKHLFSQGISQSGTATCLWAFGTPGVGRYRASKLAQHLDCPTASDSDLLNCLKSKPAYDIAVAEKRFIRRDFDPISPYQPVLEEGADCIVCNSPYNVAVDKPWIVGINENEGSLKTAWYLSRPELQASVEGNADVLAEALMFANTTTYAREISNAVLAKYRGLNNTEVWTDGLYFGGTLAALNRVVGPTYSYLFSHKSQTRMVDQLFDSCDISNGNFGAGHTDELLYLFDFNIPLTPEDLRVSKSLVRLWINFAKFGRPTRSEEWPQYNYFGRQFLNIATADMQIGSDLWPDRRSFWESLPIRNILSDSYL